MTSNEQEAQNLLRRSGEAEPQFADLMVKQAQAYATLSLIEAVRDLKSALADPRQRG